jgi:hypothetical protein
MLQEEERLTSDAANAADTGRSHFPTAHYHQPSTLLHHRPGCSNTGSMAPALPLAERNTNLPTAEAATCLPLTTLASAAAAAMALCDDSVSHTMDIVINSSIYSRYMISVGAPLQ